MFSAPRTQLSFLACGGLRGRRALTAAAAEQALLSPSSSAAAAASLFVGLRIRIFIHPHHSALKISMQNMNSYTLTK